MLVAFTVTVPAAFAVNRPFSSIVARAVLSTLHSTPFSPLPSGLTIAMNSSVLPASTVLCPLLSDTLTLFITGVTLTSFVAVNAFPAQSVSSVVAVTVTVPAAFAVRRPASSTVATEGLSTDHVTF